MAVACKRLLALGACWLRPGCLALLSLNLLIYVSDVNVIWQNLIPRIAQDPANFTFLRRWAKIAKKPATHSSSENLQREDVHRLEEAEAYETLMASDAASTVEAIAAMEGEPLLVHVDTSRCCMFSANPLDGYPSNETERTSNEVYQQTSPATGRHDALEGHRRAAEFVIFSLCSSDVYQKWRYGVRLKRQAMSADGASDFYSYHHEEDLIRVHLDICLRINSIKGGQAVFKRASKSVQYIDPSGGERRIIGPKAECTHPCPWFLQGGAEAHWKPSQQTISFDAVVCKQAHSQDSIGASHRLLARFSSVTGCRYSRLTSEQPQWRATIRSGAPHDTWPQEIPRAPKARVSRSEGCAHRVIAELPPPARGASGYGYSAAECGGRCTIADEHRAATPMLIAAMKGGTSSHNMTTVWIASLSLAAFSSWLESQLTLRSQGTPAWWLYNFSVIGIYVMLAVSFWVGGWKSGIAVVLVTLIFKGTLDGFLKKRN